MRGDTVRSLCNENCPLKLTCTPVSDMLYVRDCFSWSKHLVNSNRLKENTANHLISIRSFTFIYSTCIWQKLLAKATYLVFKVHILSLTAFPGNRTRELGVALFKLQEDNLQFEFEANKLKKTLHVHSSGDCLLDPPEKSIPLPTELPGRMFGLDRQCQQAFGDEYTHCPNAPEDQACAQMWCREEGKIQCTTRNGSLPWADGTPCGEDRRCREGSCVSSALEEAGEEKVCMPRRMCVCASSGFITLLSVSTYASKTPMYRFTGATINKYLTLQVTPCVWPLVHHPTLPFKNVKHLRILSQWSLLSLSDYSKLLRISLPSTLKMTHTLYHSVYMFEEVLECLEPDCSFFLTFRKKTYSSSWIPTSWAA